MIDTRVGKIQGVAIRCLAILSRKDKIKLFLLTVFQIFLAFLDLLGVGLLGVIGSLTINGVSAKQPGNRVQALLDLLWLTNFPLQTQVSLIAIFAVFTLALKTILSMWLIRKTTYFLAHRSAILSANLISRLLAQSILKIQAKSNQETIFTVTKGVEVITLGVLSTLASLISDSSLLLIMAIGLLLVDPLLFGSTFLVFSIVGYSLFYFTHSRAKLLGQKNRQVGIENNSLLLEVLTAYREIVVKNRRHYFVKEIAKQRYDLAKTSAELSMIPNSSKYVFEISIVIGSLLISAVQFITNDASRAVATLMLFLAASTRIAPAVLRIQQSLIRIRTNSGVVMPTLELIDKLNSEREEMSENESDENEKFSTSHIGFVPSICIEEISFSYPERTTKAIDNLSLKIKPGELVALVGPSGGGKSTLVDLMLGLLRPDSGSVTINGMEPLDVFKKWPGAVAYVPQDAFIFNDSVRNNIVLGFSSMTIEESNIIQALKFAHLDELIENLPYGLETILGDRGTRLSGGQRQRLAIARALLSYPKLIILDEATSSLDGDVESSITAEIEGLNEDSTVVVIAHRLSTVRNADRVLYLENGHILAEGTFDELRKKVPDFDRQANLMGL
jgi:ATP-binding cassette, subfamily B, bacterial PglK